MSELMLQIGSRPSVVETNGGRVYVSVHDQYYLNERKRWKQRLSEAHPDRVNQRPLKGKPVIDDPERNRRRRNYRRRAGHSPEMVNAITISLPRPPQSMNKGYRFRRLMEQYEHWMEREIKWYKQIGLEPPR